MDSSLNQTLEPEDIEDEKRIIKNKPVGRRLLEVTEELAGCKLDGSAIVFEDSDEETVEGHIQGPGSGKALNMVETEQERRDREAREAAANAVDFEDENGQNDAKALEFSRTLVIEFNASDVDFWFMQLENEMFTCGVRSQWLKRCILVKNLPAKIQSDVKSLLVLKQSQAPADLYKRIKKEILRIHAPRKEDTFKKALSRVLVGLPSQLGQTLINDVCHNDGTKLENCCCAHIVYTLWTLQLPVAVRSHVSDMTFDAGTYQKVFESADKVFLSTKTTDVSAGVAAIRANSGGGADPSNPLEVAAFKPKNKKNKNQNNDQNKGTRNGSESASGGSNKSNNTYTKDLCSNHKKWADKAWYCLAPHTCKMANKTSPRPEKQNKD